MGTHNIVHLHFFRWLGEKFSSLEKSLYIWHQRKASTAYSQAEYILPHSPVTIYVRGPRASAFVRRPHLKEAKNSLKKGCNLQTLELCHSVYYIVTILHLFPNNDLSSYVDKLELLVLAFQNPSHC